MSKQILTKEEFMMSWDPPRMLLCIYNARARLDEAAMGFEAGDVLTQAQPRYGIPVEVSQIFLHMPSSFSNVTMERFPNRLKAAALSMLWS